MDSNSLAVRREIVGTTNTAGWKFICELGQQVIADLERKAIDEDDDERGAILRRQAKAARVFFTEFLNTVEAHRTLDTNTSEDSFLTYGE